MAKSTFAMLKLKDHTEIVALNAPAGFEPVRMVACRRMQKGRRGEVLP
jgi:hypothetical protein